MIGLKIIMVPENKLTKQQEDGIQKLRNICFGNIDPKEAKEHFYAEPFARIIAYIGNEIVGYSNIYKRKNNLGDKKFILGGIAGVCVTERHRRKGVAKEMVLKGLSVLRENKCDIACLNADISNNVHRFLYEKIGFKLMNREISFKDIHGKIIYETGSMFIPICSKKIYDYVMNSKKTFHYGKGYW
jgi:ribosomal protein S18 acetylase RimI-like enzyme